MKRFPGSKGLSVSAPVILLLAIVIYALPFNSKLICYKDFIVNQRFATIPAQEDDPVSYMVFTRDEQFEAIDGMVVFEHEVIWKSCDVYLLIEKSAAPDAVKLDTLRVEVLGNEADTLTVRATERGVAADMRMYRVD